MLMNKEAERTGTLSPVGTYLSLLKGFVCTGIIYLPKAFRNGGWAFSAAAMLLSYVLTSICTNKLMQARAKVGGSFTHIGMKAMGNTGKYMVDVTLAGSQASFDFKYRRSDSSRPTSILSQNPSKVLPFSSST